VRLAGHAASIAHDHRSRVTVWCYAKPRREMVAAETSAVPQRMRRRRRTPVRRAQCDGPRPDGRAGSEHLHRRRGDVAYLLGDTLQESAAMRHDLCHCNRNEAASARSALASFAPTRDGSPAIFYPHARGEVKGTASVRP
jgi:hypothetical protein